MPASYDPERERRRIETQLERERKAAEREQKAAEARQQAAYVLSRKAEASSANADLDRRVQSLATFLVAHLGMTQAPSLAGLRRNPSVPPLELGDLGSTTAAAGLGVVCAARARLLQANFRPARGRG
jgi:hypothetical protein